MSDFGSRLKEVRKARGITQTQLAESLGVAQSTIANYEKNLRFPGETSLREIADHLSITIDYLMERDQIPGNGHSISGETPENLTDLQSRFLEDLMMGREEKAFYEITRLAMGKRSFGELFDEVFVPTLKKVGELWERGDIEIAQEHYISDIVDRLIGLMIQEGSTNVDKPFFALFLLPGAEEHSLGLKMSAACFRKKGWKTVYLGKSLPVSSLERFLQSNPIDLLVLSVTLEKHMNSCEHLIKAIKGFPEAYRPKVLVGGRAVEDSNQALRFLGADIYAASFKGLEDIIEKLEKISKSKKQPD